MVTPALPEDPAYSHTIPPPGVEVDIGPLKVAPRAVLAWARVGQVAAVVVPDDVVGTTAVVVLTAGAEVVDGDVDAVVAGLPLLDPQAVNTTPVITAPTTRNPPFLTPKS